MIFLVTARAQSKHRAEEEHLQKEKEKRSGPIPSSLDNDPSDKFEVWIQNLDNGLYEGGRAKQTLTREQKRKNRQAHWEDKSQSDNSDAPPIGDTDATESDHKSDEEQIAKHALDVSAEEMRTLQSTDTTLDAVREAAEGKCYSAGVGFFKRDGLLYRKWTLPGQNGQDMEVEQLVLPQQFRGTILTFSSQHTSISRSSREG